MLRSLRVTLNQYSLAIPLILSFFLFWLALLLSLHFFSLQELDKSVESDYLLPFFHLLQPHDFVILRDPLRGYSLVKIAAVIWIFWHQQIDECTLMGSRGSNFMDVVGIGVNEWDFVGSWVEALLADSIDWVFEVLFVFALFSPNNGFSLEAGGL